MLGFEGDGDDLADEAEDGWALAGKGASGSWAGDDNFTRVEVGGVGGVWKLVRG